MCCDFTSFPTFGFSLFLISDIIGHITDDYDIVRARNNVVVPRIPGSYKAHLASRTLGLTCFRIDSPGS